MSETKLNQPKYNILGYPLQTEPDEEMSKAYVDQFLTEICSDEEDEKG